MREQSGVLSVSLLLSAPMEKAPPQEDDLRGTWRRRLLYRKVPTNMQN